MEKRILIAGGPNAGKTTEAKNYKCRVRSTDDLISLGWSEASEEAARWMAEPGPWVIEGVAVARAIRKWLRFNPGLPCDELYYYHQAHVPLSKGQAAMAKGIETVMDEIMPELRRRGFRPMVRGSVIRFRVPEEEGRDDEADRTV